MTNGNPRVRGGLIYIPGLASKGVLVMVGGATGSSNLNLGNLMLHISTLGHTNNDSASYHESGRYIRRFISI
jgi:hypothetical protein